jgi:hypothetical protein
MATTTTTAAKWTTLLQQFRSTEAEHETKALDVLDELVDEAVPAYRLARLDHVARARRVSAKSLIARVRGAAAPGDDTAKLRSLMRQHPRRFEDVPGALHALEGRVRDLLGWRLNPPVDSEDGLLRNMTNNEMARERILLQLARFNFNPVSLLALAIENVAAAAPESFGDVDLDGEGKEIEEALARVAAVKSALGAEPRLRDRLLARHRVASHGALDPAEALLAARAATP